MCRIPGAVSPGHSALDRTPRRPPSIASMFDSMISPALLTE
jgi:hypothetical protein